MLMLSFQVAVISYVFCEILTDREMIFEFYYHFLKKIKYNFIAKPLGLCAYCFGGQLSLWLYLYKHIQNYCIFEHIFVISFSIFILKIINIISLWKT